MNLVLDTNVVIAAFIARGRCSELVEYCVRAHVVVCSSHILGEFRRNLADKFHIAAADVAEAVRLLRGRVCMVEPRPFGSSVCRDPADDAILSTALAGECACIVTGDKDLLVLDPFQGIRILSPRDFWAYEGSVP